LTAGRGLLTVASGFGLGSRSSWSVVTWCARARSFFAGTCSTRTLRSWTARANARAHSSFSSDTTKKARLGLFNYFDLRVVAVYTQVGEGSVGRLFD
jgi:hypothetical protein